MRVTIPTINSDQNTTMTTVMKNHPLQPPPPSYHIMPITFSGTASRHQFHSDATWRRRGRETWPCQKTERPIRSVRGRSLRNPLKSLSLACLGACHNGRAGIAKKTALDRHQPPRTEHDLADSGTTRRGTCSASSATRLPTMGRPRWCARSASPRSSDPSRREFQSLPAPTEAARAPGAA